MKKILHLIFFSLAVQLTYGQSWLNENSKLYYLTPEGKVFIQPDYGSYAVYFRTSPTESNVSALKAKSTAADVQLMPAKEMSILKGISQRNLIGNNQSERVSSLNLEADDVYDVLPSFRIDDQQVWFTKRVTIKLKDGKSLAQIKDLLDKYEAVFLRNTVNSSYLLLEVEKIENQLSLIQALGEQGIISWGQPDFRVEITKFDDPLYPEQFQMNNIGGTLDGETLLADVDIDAPEAWGISTGVSSITVAVIDDGVEFHPDLPALSPGFTPATSGDGTPLSNGAHGVACAGIIAAQHNDVGVQGVAPGVDMFSVNIFQGSESIQDLADAFTWSVNQGADVISNSWGFSGTCAPNLHPVLTSAINDAANNGRGGLGCVIVFASGNDYGNCVSYPGNLASVVGVGAVMPSGSISQYSNQGTDLDVVAPSNGINNAGNAFIYGVRTTDRVGNQGYASGDYTTTFGGTSAACPAVAGVAALVLSVNSSLSSTDVYSILTSTADDMGSNGFDNTFGYGRVNAFEAALAAGGVIDTETPTIPTNLVASNVGSSSVDLDWSPSSDNVAVAGYNVYANGNLAGSSSSNSYTLSGLSPSTSYSITVSAYDAAGNESAVSNAVSITTTEATLSCSGTISTFPYAEGFESGDGWTQVSGDNGDWLMDNNGTPSASTGPSSAAEGTFYMFLEASTNGSIGQIGPNATAILESDCIDLSSATSTTFSFQYHMYGATMGELSILVSTDDVSWNTLWSLSGDQGNAWSSQSINLDAYNGSTIKLRISGTTGSSWTSDMAIDDLEITTTTGGGGCTDQLVSLTDFESGLGIWNDGGSDARSSAADAAFANSGSFCVRLRDNTTTSVITTDGLDLSSFEDLTVSFSYITSSMDNSNEDFWLQVSTDGGSTFTTVEEWNLDDEFVNNVRYDEEVTIAGPFSANTQVRFRCDASANNDLVYLDDIEIGGCSSGATVTVTDNALTKTELGEASFDLEDIAIYPNPVNDMLTVSGIGADTHVSLIGLSGRVIDEGVGKTSFTMSGLKAGMYLLRITIDEDSKVIKVIKK